MNKIHITGYGSMLYFICRSTFITLLLPFLIPFKQDGIVVCILGSIIGFFIFQIFQFLLKKNTKEHLIAFIDTLPKGLGFLFNLIIAALILYFGFLLFTKLNHFTHFEYLPSIPSIILYLLFLGVLLFLAHKSFETISKASLIFFIFSILMLLVKGVGLVNQIDLTNMMPLLRHPNFSILTGSIQYAFITTLPLGMLLLISKKEIEPQKGLYHKLNMMYIMTAVLLWLQVFFIITVLGPNLISIYTYPEFHLLSNVKILGFIDKLESVLSIGWIIDIMICLSLCLIYLKTFCLYYFKHLFPKLYDKIAHNNHNYGNQEIY